MKLVILLLVLPCVIGASKKLCSTGTQSCLIDGIQTCCDTQFSEDAESIKPFYTGAKESQYFNGSSTNASLNVQHGFWCDLVCTGKCCPNDNCCPLKNGVCCPKEGCCKPGQQCCADGCCPATSRCCADTRTCCPYGRECCGGYCCVLGAKCCDGTCSWLCFGAAGITSPTVSVLIVMFVLSLKMRFN